MSFKQNATKIEIASVVSGFFGALVHIMLWLVPEITSPSLTGTGLTRSLLPNFMHLTATVIIAAGIAELSQIGHRPTAAEKLQMITGASMSITAGIIHFAVAMGYGTESQPPVWLTYSGNVFAITGALTSSYAIGQWNKGK